MDPPARTEQTNGRDGRWAVEVAAGPMGRRPGGPDRPGLGGRGDGGRYRGGAGPLPYREVRGGREGRHGGSRPGRLARALAPPQDHLAGGPGRDRPRDPLPRGRPPPVPRQHPAPPPRPGALPLRRPARRRHGQPGRHRDAGPVLAPAVCHARGAGRARPLLPDPGGSTPARSSTSATTSRSSASPTTSRPTSPPPSWPSRRRTMRSPRPPSRRHPRRPPTTRAIIT